MKKWTRYKVMVITAEELQEKLSLNACSSYTCDDEFCVFAIGEVR